MVALPTRHPAAKKKTIDPALLHDLACIASPLARAGVPRNRVLPAAGEAAERIHFHGEDVPVVLALVGQGLGAALLPSLTARHPPRGVTIRPLSGEPLTPSILIARLRTDVAPPAVARLSTRLHNLASELKRA